MSREERVKLAIEGAKRVFQVESEAIAGLVERLDARFEKAVDILYGCKGRVVVTGLGKSGLIGRKVAATFSSMGTPSLFLHAADALHGDLGMLAAGDVLVAISSSGETQELVDLIEPAKRLGIPLITLTAHREFASRDGQRRGARHQRERRSMHAESRSDFVHGGGAGDG